MAMSGPGLTGPGPSGRDEDRVADYADDAFLRLVARGAGASGSGAARAALAESAASLAVACDVEGHPLRLFTRTGRVPLVLVDAAEPMRRVLAADYVSLLTSGVPALVVVTNSRIVGVLTAEAVSSYLVDQPLQSRGLLGDEQLHGPAAVTPLTLTCSTCGTKNAVTFYVAGKTPCSKGHPLTLPWD